MGEKYVRERQSRANPEIRDTTRPKERRDFSERLFSSRRTERSGYRKKKIKKRYRDGEGP